VIAAVVLAAGGSARLGRPKQLLVHEGRTLLRRAVDAAREGGCRPVFVVLGAGADALRADVAAAGGEVVLNEAWERGLGSSIRAGVREAARACPPVGAVALLAADQPRLAPEVVRRLRERWEAGDVRIVACRYAGTLGVPALFDRALFPELQALDGPLGAKPVLAAHAGEVVPVDWPDGAIDVDVHADGDLLRP
jgi:molybdenum cofactor cytidylyltransferase